MSIVIGLTGQSGAGKTTVSDTFKRNGFAVIDCDLTAREVTDDGSECNIRLAEFFPDCFDNNYHLDRKKLAAQVFSDKEKLKLLDDMIYPYILKLIGEKIARYQQDFKYIVLDAPTLFEAGADKLCSIIVSVVADEKIRLKRIILRDGIDELSAKKRFDSQHSSDFFRKKSDYVIENNGDISSAVRQTENLIEIIKGSINGE